MKKTFLGILGLFCLLLQENKAQNIGIKDCRAMPHFAQALGFDLSKSAFSTSEKKVMGLTLIEFAQDGNNKTYQHPSWKSAGYLSAIAITERGEIFCVPTPVVNVLHNKPEEQNIIYRVNPKTGELEKYLELPIAHPPHHTNPYGLIGLAYDCDTKVLYASTLMGSTIDKENGAIFAIQTTNKQIIAKKEGTDYIGLGIIRKGAEKRLMLGTARNNQVISMALDSSGKFVGDNTFELSLEGLGQRGDDVAKKIRMNPDGTLIITGLQFYYNLTAPTEKPESKYIFIYNTQQSAWILQGIQ